MSVIVLAVLSRSSFFSGVKSIRFRVMLVVKPTHVVSSFKYILWYAMGSPRVSMASSKAVAVSVISGVSVRRKL